MDARPRTQSWSDPEKTLLRTAYRRGGPGAAAAAFPARSPASVFSAIRRYVWETEGIPLPIDRSAIRARLQAIPIDVFADRLAALLARSASYQGRPANATGLDG